MKRPLMFRLVRMWCAIHVFMLLAPLSKLPRSPEKVDGLELLLRMLPFAIMLVGTIGLYRAQRWAAWLCAATLTLLTLWLPFGYMILISKGGNPGPLLVVFGGLATVNIIATVYLARLASRGFFDPSDGNSNSSR